MNWKKFVALNLLFALLIVNVELDLAVWEKNARRCSYRLVVAGQVKKPAAADSLGISGNYIIP